MNKHSADTPEFPRLPIMSLSTADEISTHDLSAGRMTIIDFWTTACVKCPGALDNLNELAVEHPDVQFVSICCDSLDGAREIIERDEELRWSSIQHFYMSRDDKEMAKKVLGFKRVPFYVVLDEEGRLVEKGNNVDFTQYLEDQENMVDENNSNAQDVFVIDDLDF